jgi:hypothetical protein
MPKPTTLTPPFHDFVSDAIGRVLHCIDCRIDRSHYCDWNAHSCLLHSSDVLLVWDRNGNGKIDSSRELFGNDTLLANSSKAANGFAALAELDVSHDGKVNTPHQNSSIFLNLSGITKTMGWQLGKTSIIFATQIIAKVKLRQDSVSENLHPCCRLMKSVQNSQIFSI